MVGRWLAEGIRFFGGQRAGAARIAPSSQLPFDEAMTIAAERLDAADVLGRCPHRAESIHVLTRGLLALDAAIGHLNAAQGESISRAISQDTVESLRTFQARLATAPAVDAELSAEDLAAWEEARSFAVKVHARLRRATVARRTVIARRVGLALAALALAAAACFSLARLLHDRFEVVASDRYSADFVAERAVDGDAATEWLAPDGADGWVELQFAEPITVTAVRVVNAHNASYKDRATKDLEIELYRDDKLVKRAAAIFDGIDATTTPRTIPIEARRVTRVRFVARSHHGKGAGLAEVEVIE